MTDTPEAEAHRRRLKAEAIYAYEERAAILEHEAGFHRDDAEVRAARECGGKPRWSGDIVRVIEAGQPPQRGD